MKWNKFTIETTEDGEDLISGVLYELGITNIEIEDLAPVEALEGEEYEELQPDRPEDEGQARVSFYLEEDKDFTRILEEVKFKLDELKNNLRINASTDSKEQDGSGEKSAVDHDSIYSVDIGSCHITTSVSDEADWRDKWKDYFHSFSVGDLFLYPSWEELPPEKADGPHLSIDPGITFGTGKHETTQLCIRALQQYVKSGDRILDVGCGSGILDMVSLLCGAGEITGTDIDPACQIAVHENFSRNGLDENRMHVYIGDLTTDESLRQKTGDGYDIVVANILADIIIGMIDVIYDKVKPGGIFIASGIIDFKQKEVEDAFRKSGFTVTETHEQGEWRSVIGLKDSDS